MALKIDIGSEGRPIIAILHRKRKQVWAKPRRYSNVVNALKRATELAFLEGQPGDVIELAHVTGFQICTAKLKVGGRLEFDWSPILEGLNSEEQQTQGEENGRVS